ncbi:MAG: hypothetical protein V4537_00300 [Pseudomonadota bacterium]
MISLQIARMIAHFSLFLDQTDDNILDPDAAVQAMEQMSSDLQALDKPFLRELVDAFAVIAAEYEGDTAQLVRDIPGNYYLEETLAADDPVKLADLDARRDAKEA